jgi:hypothetical protein
MYSPKSSIHPSYPRSSAVCRSVPHHVTASGFVRSIAATRCQPFEPMVVVGSAPVASFTKRSFARPYARSAPAAWRSADTYGVKYPMTL